MAVRIFALALVVAQVVACGECVFHGDFEHDLLILLGMKVSGQKSLAADHGYIA